MNDLVQVYNHTNTSYRKKFVFHLGNDAGFFSEFNNMVLAMFFCLKHNIRFSFFSRSANFALKDGWEDFFLPFCKEDRRNFHRVYNIRPNLFKSRKERYLAKVYKILYGIDYLTQDLWYPLRMMNITEETIYLPELELKNASLLDTTKKIISLIWRYNPKSAAIINEIKSAVTLPQNYISMHIRSGDKFTEDPVYSVSEYMEVAQRYSSLKNAFVLTDDYSIMEELNEKYPEWNFFTLCAPSERGYYHRDFQKKDKEFKYQQHLKLFANIEICTAAQKFIGTYSSNIGMYLGMRCGENFCDCLDSKSWIIR